MNSFSYFYCKAVTTVIRLGLYYSQGGWKASPDEIINVPSRDDNRTIKIHVYRSNVRSKSPVLINFHGSGFVIPQHGDDDEFARRISNDTDYTVIDASYRLAPEDPYPAALNDIEDVIKWVLNHPQDYDVSQIALSGFSAGGNLALAVSSTVFSKDTFKCIITFYPPTDIAMSPTEKKAPDQSGQPFPDWLANLFNDCYTPAPLDRKLPTISPTYARPESFPDNIVVFTCAYDNLCMEAENLATKISNVPGKNVIIRRMEGCNHGWDKSSKPDSHQEKAKNEAYDLVVKVLRSGVEEAVN